MRSEVTALDLDRREVEVRDHAGASTYRLGFDHLVLATGARPRRPDLPGVDADGHPRRADPGRRRAAARGAASATPRRAVVVGGGYIGIEMAEAMVRRGLVGHGARPGRASRWPPSTRTWAGWCTARWRAWASTCAPRSGWTAFETDADGRVQRGRDRRRDVPGRPGRARHRRAPGDDAGARGRAAAGPVGRAASPTCRCGVFDADGVWAAGDCVESIDLVSRQPGARRARAPTPTSRAGCSAPTSAAATRRSRASSVRRSARSASWRSPAPGLREADCDAVGLPVAQR